MKKLKVLFVCTMNRMRSRTAEDLYKDQPGLEVRSAGVDKEAVQPVTLEMLKWADVIFCFEPAQRKQMRRLAKGSGLNIICLDIPDRFVYGSRALIGELKSKLTRYLGEPPGFLQVARREDCKGIRLNRTAKKVSGEHKATKVRRKVRCAIKILDTTTADVVIAGVAILTDETVSFEVNPGFERLMSNVIKHDVLVFGGARRVTRNEDPVTWFENLPYMYHGSYMWAEMVRHKRKK